MIALIWPCAIISLSVKSYSRFSSATAKLTVLSEYLDVRTERSMPINLVFAFK
jgi:hypothetical protein